MGLPRPCPPTPGAAGTLGSGRGRTRCGRLREAASAGRSGRRRGASQPEKSRSGRVGSCCIKAHVRERSPRGSGARSLRLGLGLLLGAGPAGIQRGGRLSLRQQHPPRPAAFPRQPQFWWPGLAGRGRCASGRPAASANQCWRRLDGPGGSQGPWMRPLYFPTPTARAALFPGFLKCSACKLGTTSAL